MDENFFWVANKDTSAVQSLVVCFAFFFWLYLATRESWFLRHVGELPAESAKGD